MARPCAKLQEAGHKLWVFPNAQHKAGGQETIGLTYCAKCSQYTQGFGANLTKPCRGSYPMGTKTIMTRLTRGQHPVTKEFMGKARRIYPLMAQPAANPFRGQHKLYEGQQTAEQLLKILNSEATAPSDAQDNTSETGADNPTPERQRSNQQ